MTCSFYKNCCLLIIVIFLLITPFFITNSVGAQTTEETSDQEAISQQINKLQQVYDSLKKETMTISITPSNPTKNENIVANLSTPSIDLDQAKITWYINDKVQKSDYGLKSFSFDTGDFSSSITLKAIATNSNGMEGNGTFILNPGEAIIMWESISYVPPFYKGKALPSRGGVIRAVVLSNLTNASGKQIKSNNLTYKWFKNDTLISQYSGYNKNLFYFEDSTFIRDGNDIKVQVYDTENTVYKENKVFVPHYDPKIFFYQEHPLLGRLYNKTVESFQISGQSESQIIAEPYFISNGKYSSKVSYDWTVNGNALKIGGPVIKVGNTNNIISDSIIGLTVKNSDKLLQGANNTFTISSNYNNINNNVSSF